MTVLVVGATGMTGRCVVAQLLEKGHAVRTIVRSPEKLPSEVLSNPNLTIIEASVLDLSDNELATHAKDCDAIVSCLGHVISFAGMYGEPKKLCTDATRRLCDAIKANTNDTPTKFILMNTVGVSNPERNEKRTLFDRALLTLLRYTIPPHRDNETAAAYLFDSIGKENPTIEWCAVRPDSLINDEVTPYDILESPITGIVTGRPTTRANVAHFMVALIEDPSLWNQWKFQAPVIMNREDNSDQSQ